MNTYTALQLKAAWRRVDERLAALQLRHRENGDFPLYEAALRPPATDKELQQLEKAWRAVIPFELAFSLRCWNGRWIAHDHAIDLAPISDHLRLARYPTPDEYYDLSFETVIGPINPVLESKKRFLFGSHQYSGSNLYLDYEDPPAGGRLGQVIRIGEDPIAEFVAGSFVDFLNLLADAPVHDDNPEFDPFEWRPR